MGIESLLCKNQLCEKIEKRLSLVSEYEVDGDFLGAAKTLHQIAKELIVHGKYILAADMYHEAALFYSEEKKSYKAGEMYKHSGDLYHSIHINKELIEMYKGAGDCFEECKEDKLASECFRCLAIACTESNDMFLAGENYHKAGMMLAKVDLQHNDTVIRENYLDAACAYAFKQENKLAERSYLSFWEIVNERGDFRKEEFRFYKLIDVFSINGMDDLASRAYVDLMTGITKTECFNLKKGVLWFLGITSKFGESVPRWALSIILIILFFALIYLPTPLPSFEGFISFKMPSEMAYKAPCWTNLENLCHNLLTSFCFSVTVFTTLGFGNIYPTDPLGQVIVSCEVLVGYAFLGVFITIVARKIFRKERFIENVRRQIFQENPL